MRDGGGGGYIHNGERDGGGGYIHNGGSEVVYTQW